MLNLFTQPAYTTQDEIIVDLFAGGGGASTGIAMALGRDPEAAVNHNPKAIQMHMMNHPFTEHFTEDVWAISPSWVTNGRPVGLLWASPDCTHFSKAKGGSLHRCERIRSLAEVITDKWVREAKPRVIIMENVEEFKTWCDLIPAFDKKGKPKYNKKTGLREMVPDPTKIDEKGFGNRFKNWVRKFKRAGYKIQWRELRACDYDTPTIRKRLFIVARCDGLQIVFPKPTHGDPKSKEVKSGKLLPWRTAAECIDFSLPCPSIFNTRAENKAQYDLWTQRPLADDSLTRIAKGVFKFVVNNPDPFIVSYYGPKNENEFRGQDINSPLATQTTANRHALVTPFLTEFANASNPRVFNAEEPLRTQCAQVKGGHFAVVSGFLAKNYTGVVGVPFTDPVPTVTTIDHNSVIAAHIERSFSQSKGNSATAPLGTITANYGGKCALVSSHIAKYRGGNVGSKTDEPLHTVSAQGLHHAEVRAFLLKYYGSGIGQDLNDPLHTVTSKDRFGLVTVNGEEYFIADIGIRMLSPRELYRAQGFPEDYIIDHILDGSKLTKADQVRMVGNSVCPPLAAALVTANCADMAATNHIEQVREMVGEAV